MNPLARCPVSARAPAVLVLAVAPPAAAADGAAAPVRRARGRGRRQRHLVWVFFKDKGPAAEARPPRRARSPRGPSPAARAARRAGRRPRWTARWPRPTWRRSAAAVDAACASSRAGSTR